MWKNAFLRDLSRGNKLAAGTHGSFPPPLTCGRHHQFIMKLFSTEPRTINWKLYFTGQSFGMPGIWYGFENGVFCELFLNCEFTWQLLNSIHPLKPKFYPTHSGEVFPNHTDVCPPYIPLLSYWYVLGTRNLTTALSYFYTENGNIIQFSL